MGAPIDWARYQAVLFDLDGVLTDTARLHAAAWKATFDDYLSNRAEISGQRFVPFDSDADYLNYVDGRPRFGGVDTFLRSRGIVLEMGRAEDPPGDGTVCAVGNRKNELIGRILAEQGVEVYPGSRRLVEALDLRGMAMAVVTSSANANAVLEAAGLDEILPIVVDGTMAVRLGLAGKPHPDPFLAAARILGVEPVSAVVIEDALSGVAAGRAGGFGLVVGVCRHDDRAELLAAGADLVVGDLGELVPV